MSKPKYTRICYEQRVVIGDRFANGESIPSIARKIGVSHTTVYRELKRNSNPSTNKTSRVNRPKLMELDSRKYRGTQKVVDIREAKLRHQSRLRKFESGETTYSAKDAEDKAKTRRSHAHKTIPKLLQPQYAKTLERVLLRLGKRSSPRQIELHLIMNQLPVVSENSIYRYIHTYSPNLKQHLRRRGRARRNPNKAGWNNTDNLPSIHTRPKAADDLERLGDLEGDTIFGKDTKDRLLTHVDRLTGLGSISLILGFNARNTSEQTVKDLKRMFGNNIHTITYDRGVEFSDWEMTESLTGAKIYFADPYSSYQRGRNENFNGLVRDFFPKGTDFKKLTNKDILRVESILNNRERERLNGLTPIEMSTMCALGVEE